MVFQFIALGVHPCGVPKPGPYTLTVNFATAAMNKQPHKRDESISDEQPPFGRSWTMLYALVIINLAVLVVLFYLFTRTFR